MLQNVRAKVYVTRKERKAQVAHNVPSGRKKCGLCVSSYDDMSKKKSDD